MDHATLKRDHTKSFLKKRVRLRSIPIIKNYNISEKLPLRSGKSERCPSIVTNGSFPHATARDICTGSLRFFDKISAFPLSFFLAPITSNQSARTP